MGHPFFTIGHTDRSIEAFLALLLDNRVAQVVDVRKMPGSRANPQFDADALAPALADHQIAYLHIAALGGLRGRSPGLAPEVNGLWRNRSFHNYADYAQSPEFRNGLETLISIGGARRSTIMCSEAVWWRCHRRIIADYLIASGQSVFHIMGDRPIAPAHLTPGAVITSGVGLTYPAADTDTY